MTSPNPNTSPAQNPHSFASAQPIYSMTGFATAQSATAEGLAFNLTFKGVNHRFLDLNMRLPSDSDGLEIGLRRILKKEIRRGHVDVTLFVDRRNRDSAPILQLNHELLATHLRLFREAGEALGLDTDPNLHELLHAPGVLASEERQPGSDIHRAAAIETSVLALAPTLLDQFNQVRAAEGAELAAELHASLLRLRALAEEATTLRTGAREAHLLRLRARIGELLRPDTQPEPDSTGAPRHREARAGSTDQLTSELDQRFLAEAALIAERSDVEEELVRLRAHIDSFLDMLSAGGELGKRLDFLLQELNREANTMLSKTTAGDPTLGLRLTTLGLEMKTEIERAREQVQNLE